MSKQSDIREGLVGIIAISNISVDAQVKFVLGYLHENDVVIKVHREVPDSCMGECITNTIKAGYVAVESLVSE